MTGAKSQQETWRRALDEFVERLRALYGERLKGVMLYGSRARGDWEEESDIDTLIVLRTLPDFWEARHQISPVASEISLKHDLVITAIPTSETDLQESGSPLFLNIRREGVVVG